MGACPLSQDRLPGSLLLLGSEAEEEIGSSRRGRSGILKTYEKLGIPLREVRCWKGVVRQDGEKGLGERRIAVDAVFDSVSVAIRTFETGHEDTPA